MRRVQTTLSPNQSTCAYPTSVPQTPPIMKNMNVPPLLFRPLNPLGLRRTGRSFALLAFLAALAGCLCSQMAHAQAPAVRFSFEDAGLTTDTNTQNPAIVLTNFSKAGTLTPTDLHGPPGSGVSGQIDNNLSLVLTNGIYVASGGSNGPGAYIAGSAALATDLGGTITSFTITEWFKSQVTPPLNSLLGRMFILGTGAAATDINAANTIGMKWQQPNEWQVGIAGGNPTARAVFPANLPTNKWLFMGIVYDGTNVMIYQGSDTAAANLISTTYAPGLTTALGGTAGLYVGNRNTRQRAYIGWIDEFRIYTNASSAATVEAIRQESAGGGPIVSSFYPDGLKLQQNTNKFVFTVVSPTSIWGPSTNITSIQMTLNGLNVSAGLTFVTNGSLTTPTNISVSYLGLQSNQTNAVLMTVQDANGKIGTSSVVFDTFNPTNFVWEAEEFDFDNGQYINNADYTSYPTNTSYYGLDSINTVDTVKGTPGTGFNASDYRAGAADGTRTQTPASTDLPRQRFLDLAAIDPLVVDHVVGNWSSAEWQNYTRTFPAGNYNVYARVSSSASSTLTLARVSSGQGTPSQTTSNLGTFTATGNSIASYNWVPLKNSLGNNAIVNLGGVSTVRLTSGGSANGNFYMLVPANTNLPSITGIYPNMLLQPTNKLVFTASSATTTINTNSITLILNGTNVSTNLVFTGSPSSWNVSYPGLLPNSTYTAAITVTDLNGSSANSSFTFDTWNPLFVVEAEDFDFSNGQFIDNPVPTTGPAPNSYFGQVGTMLVDESINGTTPFGAGASPVNYRNADPIATTPVTDISRQQFLTAGALDYNVGFLGLYFWQNYTKTWPTGTYNVYVRVASGAATPAVQHMGWDQITGGQGTTAQFVKPVGSFNIPRTGGWSAYQYVPLIDQFGNYANVTTGGTNTYRSTFGRSLGVSYPGDTTVGAANINFYMLVAPRTDLPRIDAVYPNNLVPMQATNALNFAASSPIYGINTTNIHVVLNGIDISTNLVFTGSSTNWHVNYPGLLPGTSYTAVITITDQNNQTTTTTVNFSTSFGAADFTWEAEDFDFDPAQSPVPGSGLRYIDNPVPTSTPAANSYFGQIGALDIDESAIFGNAHPGTYLYRQFDYVATEVTSDASRQKYTDAQLLNNDPTIADYDVNFWATNGWVNYTRTFPTGAFYLYARLSAGNGAFNLHCARVTSGWGTPSQLTQYLGTFSGTGASFATWQWVPLVDTNTSQRVVLSLGGTNTLQMTGDYNENVNFFELVPVPPNVTLHGSVIGTNITLSFPSQVGTTYTVYYKVSLTDPTWTQLGAPISGDGTTKLVVDAIIGGTRFYRLLIQ